MSDHPLPNGWIQLLGHVVENWGRTWRFVIVAAVLVALTAVILVLVALLFPSALLPVLGVAGGSGTLAVIGRQLRHRR